VKAELTATSNGTEAALERRSTEAVDGEVLRWFEPEL
jgi:hypothetical protein